MRTLTNKKVWTVLWAILNDEQYYEQYWIMNSTMSNMYKLKYV